MIYFTQNGCRVDQKEYHKKRDIYNLLLVLGAAIIASGLLSFLLIYFYHSSEKYIAAQYLSAPSSNEKGRTEERHSHPYKKARQQFNLPEEQ